MTAEEIFVRHRRKCKTVLFSFLLNVNALCYLGTNEYKDFFDSI